VHRLQGILETALGTNMVLPERKLERMEQFLERFPDVQEVIVDGTERPVQRPQAKEKRKQHYSGKKKRFTRKHITGSTRKKRIILLTRARPGTIHDKRQLDEADLVGSIPNEIPVEGDLGFQGLQKEFVNIRLPHKKPKGKELSEEQNRRTKHLAPNGWFVSMPMLG
jgi:hypothetical protein